MARMPTFEEIRDDFERGARAAEQVIEHPFHHRRHQTSAAPAAATATMTTSTPGGPVSLLTDAKTVLHDGLAKLEAVDEAAAAKMEALQANSGAMQLVDFALNFLHLPPSAFSVAIAALAETGKLFDPQQAGQPQPSFTPAGPQVAGQA